MNLQWLSAAAFLYTEIGLGVLFCIEFISNARWQQIFTSRLLALVKQYGNFLFSAFILLLFILFADSASRTYRYGNIDMSANPKNNPQAEIQLQMRLFRAQRNLYITGFSLFMLIILRRLITLISRLATLEASHSAAIKQAQGAADQAKLLLDENEKLNKAQRKRAADGENDDDVMDDKEKEELENTVKNLKQNLEEKDKTLKKTETDLLAMKKQSESLNREYDRLTSEYSSLERKLRIQSDNGNLQAAPDGDTKKDD